MGLGSKFVMTLGSSALTVGATLPKFAIWGLCSIGSLAVYTSPGRLVTASASALLGTYFYRGYRESNKKPEKMTDWSRYTLAPEAVWIAGLFASFSIFRPGLMKDLLSGVDATFAGLPYKMVSLCGSGLSSATTYVITQVQHYLANPLKIVDWAALYVAGNLADRTKAYITNLQLQEELYGYAVGYDANKLSSIELFNVGLTSIDCGRLTQFLGINSPIPLQISASHIRQFGSKAFSFLSYPIPYFNNALHMVGLASAASALHTISSTAFTQTALSTISIALNATSVVMSIVTQVKLSDSFSIYNKRYTDTVRKQQEEATALETKITNANTLLSPYRKDNERFFSDYYQVPQVKEVLLEFSKFSDKSKSDYIYAFAIKLLELRIIQNPDHIKQLMMAVIMNERNFTNYIGHIADHDKTIIFTGLTDITQHAKTLDAYLAFILNNIGVQVENAVIHTTEEVIAPPPGTFVTKDANLRDEHKAVAPGVTPPKTPVNITEREEEYLSKLDQIGGDSKAQAAAVQMLLQKVNAIGKAGPSMLESLTSGLMGRT